MPIQDAAKIKEKIISTIKFKGPVLPVQITKETGLNILFASAFLAELLSEKILKITNMKVGSSPVYYIPGQESQLEKYSKHLGNKEKDAFILLQENKFLKDRDQIPAIRVALRSIRDFAIPFKKNDNIYWRYFKSPEEEFNLQEPRVESRVETRIIPPELPVPEKIILQRPAILIEAKRIKEQRLDIFDQKTEKIEEKEPKKEVPKQKNITKDPKPKKKTPPQKVNEKFFNKVKEHLSKQLIEIVGIEGFSKTELLLRIKDAKGENLLVAYNKRRVTEADIIKANKKAQELSLPYILLSLGEPLKKTKDLMEALKNLSGMEKIE